MSAPVHAGGDPVRIVAALVGDAAGRALLVRKHGSSTFIQPGGKREPGEDALATLARELREELGVGIVAGSAQPLGTFEHDAVHERGRRVQAEVYAVALDGEPLAQAEIAELRWIAVAPPYPVAVAPLSADCILPLLAAGPRP
jgi:8-oxo-dGTP diphosphatase